MINSYLTDEPLYIKAKIVKSPITQKVSPQKSFHNEKVSSIYQKINTMLENNDFSQLDAILQMRDKLFDTLAAAIKSQIKRVKAKTTTTRSSILYLTIINETKTMVLQTRNLLKSQRYFMSGE